MKFYICLFASEKWIRLLSRGLLFEICSKWVNLWKCLEYIPFIILVFLMWFLLLPYCNFHYFFDIKKWEKEWDGEFIGFFGVHLSLEMNLATHLIWNLNVNLGLFLVDFYLHWCIEWLACMDMKEPNICRREKSSEIFSSSTRKKTHFCHYAWNIRRNLR